MTKLDGETKLLTATRLLELLQEDRKRIAGLEAMLCDAQAEVAELRAELGKERASHCVCKCDDDGDFVSQCLAHKAVEDELDQMRALLAELAVQSAPSA